MSTPGAQRARVSQGRHCHSTLSVTVIDCHSLGIYTVILHPLLLFSVKMTVCRPVARHDGQDPFHQPSRLRCHRGERDGGAEIPRRRR